MDSLDLGELQTTSGSIWGIYRELGAYAIAQAPNHPGVKTFDIHVEVGDTRRTVTVNTDGSLTSKEQVDQLMADWIAEAQGV